MLRGADAEDTGTIMADRRPLRVEQMEVTTEAPRTLSVYVAPSAFLAMAEAESASIMIGGREHTLSAEMQKVLKTIHDRIS